MQVDDHGVDRVEYLRKRVDSQAANPHRTTFAVRFRGSPLDLPKVRVDVGFPRYRLANGRTRRKQEQYLVDHPELPADLFTDPASDRAQRAQHEILYEMAQEASLEQMLEDEGQRDPIVITYDGFVVNGNRRLAIIREFGDVTHVDAVVLPEDADAKDISALEMRLQMAEDGKADYNWLDALLTIEANISEIGFTEEEVAREMGCYLKTIQLQRHELDLVNRYLNERGYPGEHFRVEGDKQAFETLARAHRDTPDPDRQANLRSLGFNIIAKPASGSSVHRQIEAMIRNLDTTVALINRQNGDAQVASDDTMLVSLDDLLSELDTVEKERAPVVILPVSEESAAQVHDAIEEAKGLNEERSRAHEAAAQIKQAARSLSSVKISAHTADIDVIQGQLRAIDAECARIREQLSALLGES
jgi:hypothetical protein